MRLLQSGSRPRQAAHFAGHYIEQIYAGPSLVYFQLLQYEKAAWLTLRLGVAGIFWAILVGLVCAVLQYEKVPVLRRIVGAYIQLSRNTPLLVQLFFLYYGLPKIGIKTNAELCGIAGLAFLGGSYMAEAFRSGLEAIEPIQTESALSLGMSRLQTMRYVVLPQAVSISMPAFMANIIFLLKETSVFSAIRLMFRAECSRHLDLQMKLLMKSLDSCLTHSSMVFLHMQDLLMVLTDL